MLLLGGTSTLNYMVYMRGHPQDFDHLANSTGDDGWTYENLIPYFKKFEDYHGHYKNGKRNSIRNPRHESYNHVRVAWIAYLFYIELNCIDNSNRYRYRYGIGISETFVFLIPLFICACGILLMAFPYFNIFVFYYIK
jgi:choline dehydrogenase-like flavoprotein